MIDAKKRFKVRKFLFETTQGPVVCRYMLTDNLLPLLVPNQYIEAKSINKPGTGKVHANKLCVFFNYLDENHQTEYDNASNKHVQRFLNYLIYGDLRELKINNPADSHASVRFRAMWA